ncbi:MAG: hypothetical protein Q7J59_05560 [Elusimicrobiota bacterium]|nr:hypothetical protein [Elusimicrobiota bacterium]
MKRRALLILAIVTMSSAVPFLCAQESKLKIRADKLVYLERGEVAEFRKNVVFERDDFKGRSRYLKLDKKKNKIFASGAVSGDILNQGRGDMSFATEKLFYDEASGAVFSPDKSGFVVNVSTTATRDIYTINCSSFSGNIPDKRFHLTGKPVTIKGERLSGFSDTLDCSPTVTEMRGNARLDYFEPPGGDAQNAPAAGRSPWNADANYIKMSFESEEYEFKGDVTGVFYPKNAENP